jgi:hypothetical protein
MLLLAFCVVQARSEAQTRFYGPDGKSIGTAVPYGNGSVRYYDSRKQHGHVHHDRRHDAVL